MAVAGGAGSRLSVLLRRQPLFALAALAIVGLPATIVPLPGLLLEAPGRSVDVVERVALPHPDTIDGDYLFVTVSLSSPSAVEWLWARTTPGARVRPRKTFIADDVDTASYFRDQRDVFAAAASVAVGVGLQGAGRDVDFGRVSPAGVRVTAVLPGSPAAGRLLPGDVILEAGDVRVLDADDLRGAVDGSGAGGELRLLVERDQAQLVRHVVPVEVDGRPRLGVRFATRPAPVVLPAGVVVASGDMAGPSAGLLIALATYDLADPGDLAAGRRIAGTGSLAADGTVGRVGAVPTKVRTALGAGADVFLVHASQAAEAVDVARARLEVLGVETFAEAVAALGG